jgi:hypothetical protein
MSDARAHNSRHFYEYVVNTVLPICLRKSIKRNPSGEFSWGIFALEWNLRYSFSATLFACVNSSR